MTGLATVDVAIVGAGVVGLGLALHAVDLGMSVVVVERDERAVGASVRNFGHVGVTAQAGRPLEFALVARETWLRIATLAGVWLRESGTVVVARTADEHAVLAEFADLRGTEQVRLLTSTQVGDRTGAAGAVAGAWFPLDLRVDARSAIPAMTDWLTERGVRFVWGTAVRELEPGLLRTSRGVVHAERVFVAVGHNVDRVLPAVADTAGVQRCVLHMLGVDAPTGRTVDPAVLTGHSLLRYDGFLACPSVAAVRDRLAAEQPDTVDAGLNLMCTQRPDGMLVVGDTHAYVRTPAPFDDARLDDLVVAEMAALFGVESLVVRQRWRGVYAAANEPYLVAQPHAGVTVVSVTSGIGMTTAFGLTAAVMDGAFEASDAFGNAARPEVGAL